ncbi:hypothetical protein FDUTEX481_07802 [Tolypothrix sp. PCC 7601]|nr:hypothetical protein FDUTEX481_07802 [Tolypothrix sp. PCC 7601]
MNAKPTSAMSTTGYAYALVLSHKKSTSVLLITTRGRFVWRGYRINKLSESNSVTYQS